MKTNDGLNNRHKKADPITTPFEIADEGLDNLEIALNRVAAEISNED